MAYHDGEARQALSIKWCQRFNREQVTTDPLKTLHSMRHSFADTLKQFGVQETLISELMGHANSSITTGRYGKRCQAKVLFEEIRRIDYGFSEGSHH